MKLSVINQVHAKERGLPAGTRCISMSGILTGSQ